MRRPGIHEPSTAKRLNAFERYLSLWVALCMGVGIFAFQSDNITSRSFHILLIAVPILIQVYFNSSLAYGPMKWLKVPTAWRPPGR